MSVQVKNVALHFDEMGMKQALLYDEGNDTVEGLKIWGHGANRVYYES